MMQMVELSEFISVNIRLILTHVIDVVHSQILQVMPKNVTSATLLLILDPSPDKDLDI